MQAAATTSQSPFTFSCGLTKPTTKASATAPRTARNPQSTSFNADICGILAQKYGRTPLSVRCSRNTHDQGYACSLLRDRESPGNNSMFNYLEQSVSILPQLT